MREAFKFPFIYFFWRTLYFLFLLASLETYFFLFEPDLKWRPLVGCAVIYALIFIIKVRLAYRIIDSVLIAKKMEAEAKEFVDLVVGCAERLPIQGSSEK